MTVDILSIHNAFMLNIVMLNVIRLNVTMLSIVALYKIYCKNVMPNQHLNGLTISNYLTLRLLMNLYNKEPTVWLDGAPSPVSHPASQ